ncbi:TIGR04141 family sporadically distributed protein [Streptomyces sp. YGL11-2]|uniref:TIGR04141 family sporadically distributed protein n=1 Tax=Streptomyces sp. YGL11-2 TaxID=3414028 RepID=UPI003CEBF26A
MGRPRTVWCGAFLRSGPVRLCRDEFPDPALEFVEHITPVKDRGTQTLLEQELNAAMSEPADGRITPGPPWEDYQAAGAVHPRIDACGVTVRDAFDLDDVSGRLRSPPAGEHLAGLRRSTVTLYRHHRAASEGWLAVTPVLRWIEAGISLRPRPRRHAPGTARRR